MIDSIGTIPMFIMLVGLTRENLTFNKYLLSSYQALLFYGRCKRKQMNTYVVMTSKSLFVP